MKLSKIIVMLALLALGSTLAAAKASVSVAGLAMPAAAPCKIAQPLKRLDVALPESSGAAQSRRHPELFWTHNDSSGPEVFAIDASGKVAGRVSVTGATDSDWEDIAAGPCPAGLCLYVGDIGDNHANRASVTVYRVPEPEAGDSATKPAEALRARYPDGPNDAEGLIVLAADQIYVVTKGSTGPIVLYRFPATVSAGAAPVMQKIRVLAPGRMALDERVTGASASPDGRWVALRSHRAVLFFRTADLLGGRAPAFGVDLTELHELQGEGVSLGADGSVILTGEGRGASGTYARLTCTLP